jgi:DmsE family decaheme c-type cytochrome
VTFLALPAPAQDEGEYTGSEDCLVCHDDLLSAYEKTLHSKVLSEQNAFTPLMARGCEACHGPGSAHEKAQEEAAEQGGEAGRGAGNLTTFWAETPEAIAAENAACLSCHRGGRRLYWPGGPHDSTDVACSSCHTVMKPVSDRQLLSHDTEVETCAQCHPMRRSELYRNAHMPVREDKMSCSSCHNSHGTISENLISEASVNDNCYSCHANKRGPFLWEHAPVTENCLSCHDPHGSVRDKLLKVSLPRLCQQCHVATLHPSEPRPPDDRMVLGSSCLNCHLNIHGSNHPSGFAFTR